MKKITCAACGHSACKGDVDEFKGLYLQYDRSRDPIFDEGYQEVDSYLYEKSRERQVDLVVCPKCDTVKINK